MTRRCDLTDEVVSVGNKVSHSNIKTKRKFALNICRVKLESVVLKKSLRLSVAAKVLRTVDYYGGLDQYLLKTKRAKLSLAAKKMKRQIHELVGKTGNIL